MIFEFLALPIVWISIVSILVFFSILSVNSESWGWSFILSLAILFIVADQNDISWSDIRQHPGVVVKYLVAYLAVGVVWSFGKWYFVLRRAVTRFMIYKNAYMNKSGITDPEFLSDNDECRSFVANTTPFNNSKHPGGSAQYSIEDRNYYSYEFDTLYERLKNNDQATITKQDIIHAIRPSAMDNKGRIIAWISYWPMSFVATLLNDPLRHLVEWIYDHFRNLYEAMSTRMFKGI